MARSLHYGLLGYGAWGRFHARAIDDAPNAELAAILCRSEEAANIARTDYPEVPVVSDYQELLQNGDIDVVDIVLPSSLHRDAAVRALDAGKHVLLEKPMAITLNECDDIVAAAKRNRGLLSVGHEFRFSKQWGAIKEIIDSGDIGELLYCNAVLFRFPYRKGVENWRYRSETVGSWILEEPIHFLDFALWYFEGFGRPQAVRAFATQKTPASSGLYDNFTAVLSFRPRARGIGAPFAVVSQSLDGFEHHQVVDIAGSEGSIRSLWSGAADRDSNPTFSTVVRRKGSTEPETVEVAGSSGEVFELAEQIIRTTEAFQEGRVPYPPELGREVVAICLAAEDSIREGRDIQL